VSPENDAMRTLPILLCCALAAAPISSQDEPSWRYVVPSEGEAHRGPSPTALSLSDEPPEDVTCRIEGEGALRFAQVRYGSPDSVRVAVALDLEGPRLWVDVNRDRVLEASELVDGKDGTWSTKLSIQVSREEEATLVPREVQFTLGRTTGRLSFATLGYLEGELVVGDARRPARRMDGNGDGFLTGERDSVWIDLDGNGSWSSFRELFLFAPILRIGGERWSVRSDRLGTNLAVERIEGVGRIRLDLADRVASAMQVLLVSRDGGVATVRAADEPVDVPPGEYRIDMVTLVLEDPDGGQGWGFVFSGTGERWFRVERDAEVPIDPIGEPRFHSGRNDEPLVPGETFSYRPWLTTEDNLLLNVAFRGGTDPRRRREVPGATIRLFAPDGELLESARSGFA